MADIYKVELHMSYKGVGLDRAFEVPKEDFYMMESRDLVCSVCGEKYPCADHPKKLRTTNNVFELKLKLPDVEVPE